MHWFYERDETSVSLETCYDHDADEYVAVLHHSDGRDASQRFSTLVAFRQWLLTLELELTADRWTPQESPNIVGDGWPDKPPVM